MKEERKIGSMERNIMKKRSKEQRNEDIKRKKEGNKDKKTERKEFKTEGWKEGRQDFVHCCAKDNIHELDLTNGGNVWNDNLWETYADINFQVTVLIFRMTMAEHFYRLSFLRRWFADKT